MEQQKDNYQKGPTDTRRTFQGHDSTNGDHRVGAPAQFSSSNSRPGTVVPSNMQKNPAQQGFDYVVRKAEKLTTALYLVTDIMSEKEPLKWKAREIGVDLLSDITIASSLSASEKMSMLRDIMKKAEKVIAFLDVAQSAHLMSDMNSSMLKKEYIALKDNIEGEWGRVYEASKSIFSEAFFDVPPVVSMSNPRSVTKDPDALPVASSAISTTAKEVPMSVRREEPHRLPESAKTLSQTYPASISRPSQSLPTTPSITQEMVRRVDDTKAITPTMHNNTFQKTSSTQPAVLNVPVNRQSMSVTNEQSMFVHGRSDNDKGDRRKIILALIKQKPALTVRDITKSIPQVSEKTIQRELLSMVSEGTLLKRGERRWSTYSLRQQ